MADNARTLTALDYLASIDASVKAMAALARRSAPKPIASDRDLDGTHGDPELRFLPRDWTGPDFKGRRFSECSADLLDMAAETFDYFADQAEAKNEVAANGKPVAPYKRADAARARGWARRTRSGWTAPTFHQDAPSQAPSTTDPWTSPDLGVVDDPFITSDDIPF